MQDAKCLSGESRQNRSLRGGVQRRRGNPARTLTYRALDRFAPLAMAVDETRAIFGWPWPGCTRKLQIMSSTPPSPPPFFGPDFINEFDTLLQWRRDVRRFQTEPLPQDVIEGLIGQAALAPSVGNSQPWRFVLIESADRRQAVRDHFEACNADALNDYEGEQAKLYAQLKLSGMDQAPVQLAVFCDRATKLGHGLGKKTMPETLDYSVVMAVHTLWLAARTQGIGVGWVSILQPAEVERILDVPATWGLTAYLCIGWPEEEHLDPELVRAGWQDRIDIKSFVETR